MAPASRRRNPDWTEAELIIALNTYFAITESKTSISHRDPETVGASRVLNSLEIHPNEKRTAKFRDPAGVRRRFNYFRRLQAGEHIEGRSAYVAVWNRYKDDREGLRRDAIEIEAGNLAPAEALRPTCHESTEEDIQQIRHDPHLKPTDKLALISARQGQGQYRSDLIRLWKTCAITGCRDQSLLIASHLKPWAKSSNAERLDPYNGLLLSPTWDRLFDKGLASLNDSGKVQLSPYLSSRDRSALGVNAEIAIRIDQRHLPYVRHHRNFEFKT